ncbi:argonaute/piwi family protein [Bradyrhizobium elkanii]
MLVHFPDSWTSATRTKFFDAHDALKALGAKYSIPTQVLNDRVFTFTHTASLAWRLATALYVKAAGTPWKLAPLKGVPADTAYIGLAYALRGDQRDAHYVTCCSQVFDMDGGGMQFVAFEARDPVADVAEARRNPFLSRDGMRAVLARSLELYQGRNGGNLPKRLVIHKTTAFKQDEIEGAFDALAGVPEVECVEVGTASCWRGVWLIESGRPKPPTKASGYPVPRGTVVIRSGNSALVWVAGNAPQVSSKGDYYQGKKSIPKPLQLIRHTGRGSLELTAHEALALTKMDWNNDALYDPVPVSIRYSQRLARTIANVPDLPGNVYPYRLFM